MILLNTYDIAMKCNVSDFMIWSRYHNIYKQWKYALLANDKSFIGKDFKAWHRSNMHMLFFVRVIDV